MDARELWDKVANGTITICDGVVRWVPLSPMQAHERKLQQRFITSTFKEGKQVSSTEEWHDVPFVNK